MPETEPMDLLNDEYWLVGWPVFALHASKFPYLVYRVAGGIYAPVKTPAKIKDKLALLEWAQAQAVKTNYQTCLVMSPKHAYYFNKPGKIEESRIPAMGGTVVNWEKLQNGEVKARVMGNGLTVLSTPSPNSELPQVVSTGEKIVFEGVSPLVEAN